MDFLWFLEGLRTPALTKFFEFVTLLGEETFAIAVICIVYWCVNKKLAYRISFTYFTAGLLVQTLKIFFRIPRPWVLDPSFQPVPGALRTATGYSFPSGHTQSATSLFGTLALAEKKLWRRALFVLVFLLVGFSRMYLGVHTPKDVLTSLALSLVIAFALTKVMTAIENDRKYDRLILLILAAISIAVTICAFTLYGKGIIDSHYVADCCKAAGAGLGFAVGWYLETTYIHFSTRTKTLRGQIIKAAIGLSIAVLLRSGLKLLLGTAPAAGFVRYFILVLWVVVLYPYIVKKTQAA